MKWCWFKRPSKGHFKVHFIHFPMCDQTQCFVSSIFPCVTRSNVFFQWFIARKRHTFFWREYWVIDSVFFNEWNPWLLPKSWDGIATFWTNVHTYGWINIFHPHFTSFIQNWLMGLLLKTREDITIFGWMYIRWDEWIFSSMSYKFHRR